MTIALAFVGVMLVWLTPRGWILGSVLVVVWAAISAFLMARTVRKSIDLLESSTHAIPERKIDAVSRL